MLQQTIKRLLPAFLLLALLPGCKKYLDAKPDKQFVIPGTTGDLQALLDNYNTLNENDALAVAEASSDNYYLTDIDWNSIPDNYRRMYVWGNDHLFQNFPNQWSFAYDKIYIANVVLDNLSKITRTTSNALEWDNVKGQALCFRAKTLLDIAIVWAPAFDKASAASDLGIPLRLDPDFNTASVRSSIQQTYDQVISDLKQSASLLPVTPKALFRPSKPAAYAFLARAYLVMQEFDSAYKYADLALQLKNSLMDYNSDPEINTASGFPFSQFNKEVMMESRSPVISPLDNGLAKVDSLLYRSYRDDDLRKTLFFKSNNNNSYAFTGSYEGGAPIFTGIATDEVYLIRAECAARKGMIEQAMNDLNTLMVMRWKNSVPYPKFIAVTAADALNQVLAERRKELLMRGLRWMDLKRLNKENANITIMRVIQNDVFTLRPNDLRYALPIPEEVIMRSGMQQNPR